MNGTDARQVHDESGYAIFCTGASGEIHALAHRALDAGRPEDARKALIEWLDRAPRREPGSEGGAQDPRKSRGSVRVLDRHPEQTGSEIVHLHWHAIVCELAVRDFAGAVRRFYEHVLPAAAFSAEALTDAPSALWRLSFQAPDWHRLPWRIVRATALENLDHPDDYVELHNLLALAGAGDTETLDGWIATRRRTPVLHDLARGLRAFVTGDFETADAALSAAGPAVGTLGGSRAQNTLFLDIRDAARRRAAQPARSAA